MYTYIVYKPILLLLIKSYNYMYERFTVFNHLSTLFRVMYKQGNTSTICDLILEK